MPAVPAPAALALLGALLLSGCARREAGGERIPEEPLPPGVGPIVIPNPGRGGDGGPERDRREVAPDEEAWSAKWDLASRYAAAGYDEEALAVIDAALALGPPAAWAGRLRGLAQSLEARRAEAVLRVDARGERNFVAFRAPVDLVVRLRNLSDAPLVFPSAPVSAAGEPLTPSVLVLSIRRRDIDIYSSELRRRWTQSVPLLAPGAPSLRIPPGGVHEVTARIPAADAGEPLSGIRVFEVEGLLRPAFGREGPPGLDRVPIRRGRVVALPDGFEPLARDPLGSLERAIDAVAPPHLLVATEFAPRASRREVMGSLARALGEGDPALRTAALSAIALLRERSVGEPLAPLAEPLVRALDAWPERTEDLAEALRALSGAALAPDARLWRDWWRRVRDSRSAVPPPDDARGPR
jgi:hypothetical protein